VILGVPQCFQLVRRGQLAHIPTAPAQHPIVPLFAGVAPAIERDAAQPAAKAFPAVVGEGGQDFDQRGENVLHEIGGVGILQTDAPAPGVDQRRVQRDETAPGFRVKRLAQPFQQAGGRGGHPRSLANPRGPRVVPPPRADKKGTSSHIRGRI
jgi:hypothetical protein